MQTLPSAMILVTAYQLMVTSTVMVNTNITKTSSLFMINKRVLGMGPGESSWEGTPYGWLTVVPYQA